jgi:hypothetical protein
MPDGLHPNAHGMKVLAGCLMPLVDKLVALNGSSTAAAQGAFTQLYSAHSQTLQDKVFAGMAPGFHPIFACTCPIWLCAQRHNEDPHLPSGCNWLPLDVTLKIANCC